MLALALALPGAAGAGPASELERRLTRLLDRPEGLPGLVLRRLELAESRVVIGLEVPADVRLDDLPPEVENRYELAVGAIAALAPSVHAIDVLVAHPGERLRPPPRGRRTGVSRERPPIAHIVQDPSRYPHGQALAGKTIAISPGHGYIYYDSLSAYSTQRGRVFWEGCGDCRGIVEDFETHEIVVEQLIPLLEGAGARVVLVRERAYQDAGALVEAGGAGYSELAGTFNDGSSEGGFGGNYRASVDEGASARYTVTAPIAGPQLLSMWFVAGSNRWPDATLEVRGSFGVHELVADLRTHGRRFAPIGIYDLDLGETIEVTLTAPSGTGATGALVTDAVRLGSGKHSSNHPWWQMGAQPFAAFQEAPATVTAYGDVTIRPRYAEWYGADVYVALHSNASGAERSTASGISSYRYNCGSFPDHSTDPPPADCDDPPGSDRLQELIHGKMVQHLRGAWDPAFNDRGTKVANFGELRELDGIPGVLIESAFHDQVLLAAGSALRSTDNQSLHDPRWRRAAAYGIYEGLSEYLAGPGPLLLPPPAEVAASRESATSVLVDFAPVPGARAYRVYAARGTRVFDRGMIVAAPPARIDQLAPGTVVFAKVAALNEAGEGLSSGVVTARAAARRAQVLIVDAFEREDAWIQTNDNRHDTAMTHGLALASREATFDSATEAALRSGLAAMTGYDAVVVALGAESTEHELLTPALRGELLTFASGGGAVFMSGSELAYALDARGDDTSRAFLDTLFGLAFGRDDAAATEVHADPGGRLAAGLPAPVELDDGSRGGLRARSSDVLAAAMSGAVELWYGPGQVDPAAVRRDRNIAMGVALETIGSPAARAGIMGAFLDQAITLAPVDPQPDGGVLVPDAGDVRPDAGGAEAGPPPDGGPLEPQDAGADDAEVIADSGAEPPPVGLRARYAGEPPVSGGCGCTTQAPEREAGGGRRLDPLALALVLLLAGRRPRVRRR